ncbi:MAG: SDR family oxidoreductase [Candidatus Dormibacteraeota bacterium]|nr:SDR family oxidoreductase [Candidatus Dormibacteraeota bacterium]
MIELGLKDRAVLITGGGTGIGAATARVMAAGGAHPVLLGLEADQEALEAVAAATGGVAVAGDAADPDCVRQAIARARERWGGIGTLVTCAGGSGQGAVMDMDDARWAAGIRNNLTTAFVAARECLPDLIERSGAIVVVSSRAGISGPPHLSGYITGKHALIGLVRSLASDYGPSGVRVNAVCPGFVRTRMGDAVMDRLAARDAISREQAYELANRGAPLRRPAEPEDIAHLIMFLASDWARALTGAVIPADSGWSAVDAAALELAR